MGKTSWQAKKKYNDRVYARVTAVLPKPLMYDFKAKCNREGISYTKVIKYGIMKYLEGEYDTDQVRRYTDEG